MNLYLSRAILSRNPVTTALKALIDPPGARGAGLHDPDRGRIMDAHHRLIWSLFAGDRGAERDFLWRSEGQGRFLILSPRPPAADGAGLFDPPEVKPFAPDLRVGDRLAFVLRVNATRTRRTGGREQGRGQRRARLAGAAGRPRGLRPAGFRGSGLFGRAAARPPGCATRTAAIRHHRDGGQTAHRPARGFRGADGAGLWPGQGLRLRADADPPRVMNRGQG